MYIPDLFGAYVKGRELAIDKNWQDLKNFENIEAARNQNDLAAMDVWERRQQMPGKMSMFYDNVNNSARNNGIAEAGFRGMLAKANMGSDHAVNQYGIYKAYETPLIQAMGDMFGAKIGEQSNTAQALLGKNAYLAPHAYQIGQDQGYIGHQQVNANKILAEYAPTAAQQSVNLSQQSYGNNYNAGTLQGMTIDTAIKHHPLQEANEYDLLQRVIPARQRSEQQMGGSTQLTPQQIGDMYALALGDPAARGVYLLEQAKMIPQGSFAARYGSQLAGTQAPAQAPAQEKASLTPLLQGFTLSPAELIRRAKSQQPARQPSDVWSTYQQAANYTRP